MGNKKNSLKILDIDLDFFLNDKHTGSVTSTTRLDEHEYVPWTAKEVESFLEENCGLNKQNKIPGKYFTHHVEAFYFLRELQESNNFSYQFIIDHVDAHGDLGNWDTSYIYIASELLTKPLIERAYPNIGGMPGLGSGNFLTFAIACRWIRSLSYINRIDWAKDCPDFYLAELFRPNRGIQLRQFSRQQMDEFIMGTTLNTLRERAVPPIAVEPLVPFQIENFEEFKSDGDYDYILLTQSPGFTPKSSDALIPVIQNYMQINQ